MADRNTLEALKGITTGTLTTVLLKKGLRNVWMRGTRPLRPGQGRVAGRAFTLRFVPAREDLATPASWGKPISTRAAIEAMPAGCVAVVDARGVTDAGIFGDILCARMHMRSVAGLVTDGVLRDVEGVLASRLSVWCQGVAAPPSVAGLTFVNWQEPIGCGGVAVFPDDLVVATRRCGLIPAAMVDEVASRQRSSRSAEQWIMDEVGSGAVLPGLYPLNEANRARYEAHRKDAATSLDVGVPARSGFDALGHWLRRHVIGWTAARALQLVSRRSTRPLDGRSCADRTARQLLDCVPASRERRAEAGTRRGIQRSHGTTTSSSRTEVATRARRRPPVDAPRTTSAARPRSRSQAPCRSMRSTSTSRLGRRTTWFDRHSRSYARLSSGRRRAIGASNLGAARLRRSRTSRRASELRATGRCSRASRRDGPIAGRCRPARQRAQRRRRASGNRAGIRPGRAAPRGEGALTGGCRSEPLRHGRPGRGHARSRSPGACG